MSTHLAPRDFLRTAWGGLRSRPLRSALASLGVALGIAAMVALTCLAASNRLQLLADLDRMGADTAIVRPAISVSQVPILLPERASEMVARQDGVAAVGTFEYAPQGLAVYKNPLIPLTDTNSIKIEAARPDVLEAIRGTMNDGRWFDEATRSLPTVVLGAESAQLLGVTQAGGRVWLSGPRTGGQWYGVLGILDPLTSASELDRSVFLGDEWVRSTYSGPDLGLVSALYVRAEPGRIDEVSDRLASAANPGAHLVNVSTSEALTQARSTASGSLATLGLIVGAVTLLVGGVGIANTMVVAVLERRGEVGLRRSLGARPGQVAVQFVIEAVILAGLGGVVGAGAGVAAAAVIAFSTGQPLAVATAPVLGGPAVALVVGAVAGLQPALRAARLSPMEALRSV